MPIRALAVWALIVKGDYKGVEKIFLVASVIYFAYIIAGVMSQPDWHQALVETVKLPERSYWHDTNYVYMTIGVIGTTITTPARWSKAGRSASSPYAWPTACPRWCSAFMAASSRTNGIASAR